MSLFVIPSTELITRIATMKNATPEKVLRLQHALEVNNEMRQSDFVCMYRNCLHHSSRHGGKSWKEPITGKYRKCRCRHLTAVATTNQLMNIYRNNESIDEYIRKIKDALKTVVNEVENNTDIGWRS